MARTSDQIVADLQAFQPIDGNWLALDRLLSELWATDQAQNHVSDLLGILERFPEDDGVGVLWSVVHGLESIPRYEPLLIESLQRRPSRLGVTMVRRLLNSNVLQVEGVSLVKVLRIVKSDPQTPENVRLLAGEFVADYPE